MVEFYHKLFWKKTLIETRRDRLCITIIYFFSITHTNKLLLTFNSTQKAII